MACCLGSGSWTIGGCYHQWTNREVLDLEALCTSSRIILLGNLNLNVAGIGDPSYYCRHVLSTLLDTLDEQGFRLENDLNPPTWEGNIWAKSRVDNWAKLLFQTIRQKNSQSKQFGECKVVIWTK